MTNQKIYEARIIPANGNTPIAVTVPANDHAQAKRIIEQQYGPIKSWFLHPQPKR